MYNGVPFKAMDNLTILLFLIMLYTIYFNSIALYITKVKPHFNMAHGVLKLSRHLKLKVVLKNDTSLYQYVSEC